jgi:glucan phosphoethanolaminetransferase (alkaline phosphatase superfamily)
MNTAQAQQVKTACIFVLIVSVVLGALGAIMVVLGATMDGLSQAIQTCLIMVVASACILACASLATRGARMLPLVGIALALAAAVLQTYGVWADDVWLEFGKLIYCVSIFAVACGHLAALSLARLAPRYVWSLVLAYAVIIGVAFLWAVRILDYPWREWMDQLHSILMILDIAVTILIPYFHWRSRDFIEHAAGIPLIK